MSALTTLNECSSLYHWRAVNPVNPRDSDSFQQMLGAAGNVGLDRIKPSQKFFQSFKYGQTDVLTLMYYDNMRDKSHIAERY